jgi:predicted GIY-YIG superfamily endonuclease
MTIRDSQQKFFVYILQCSDGSLYVGSTNNMEKRLKETYKKILKENV